MNKVFDKFTNLHVHSSIGSMQDSMAKVDDIFKRVAELGQTAAAITDHGSMAGVFDARKAAKKYGIKYIPGIEAYFVNDVADKKEKRRHIVLLASNEVGYRNLLQLNWEGHVNLQYVPILNKVFPKVDWEMLKKYNEGVICLTACGSGVLAKQLFEYNDDGEWLQDKGDENILETAQKLKNIFGDRLYLEVQAHSLKAYSRDRKTGDFILGKNGNKIIVADQDYINNKIIDLGRKLNIPLVATTDIHYLNKEDAKAHDVLMAIRDKVPLSDKTRHRYEVEEFYIKDSGDMISHFTKLKSRKLALELCNNTVEVANRCEDSTYLDTTETRFPQFDLKEQDDYEDFVRWNGAQKSKAKQEDHAFMRFRCVKGFRKKYGHLKGKEKKKYIKRMMDEIEIFELRNFSSYMLIVSDFILAAKTQKIPVGPGRGSVGGSLVANLLDIHSVDPIKYGLLFERFHNKEKKAYPDIDTDFSPDGRDWVEQYIVKKYGREKVAHVSNLSRMTPKVVIKDVARSMELGGGKSEAFKIANKITDSIPDNCNSFDEALQKSPEFRKYCAEYPDLEVYGRKLTGLEKSYATHAAGIVIGDIPLSTYVPLRIDKNGSVAVQYDKDRCEDEGLIKIDLLGLEHLKIIDNTVKNARSLGMKCPDPDDVPLDDDEVWKSISKGKTMCVFQMESPHMKALCKLIKPKNIEDLSVVNALGRPSAGQKDKKSGASPRSTYIARRDGKEKVSARYSCLENSLKETLGICVYEEQLMNLAADSANWDRNTADGLRKLTKMKGKNPALAKKLEEDFISDTVSFNGLKNTQAKDIWDNVIEPFSGYGFNKAHGILYSINGYHSAYYKHYYPTAFMAAVLKSEVEKASSPTRESNIRAYKKEAKRLGIEIKAPDVNFSGTSFTVLDEKTIVTGLAAVKGVGERAVGNIIEERNKHPFNSFADFLLRTSSSLVRKNVIQPLAKSGCFDNLDITRKNAFEFFSVIRTGANKHFKKVGGEGRDAWNVLDDFVLSDKINKHDEWSLKERLQGEQETLGEYISGTANDIYNGFFSGKNVTSLAKIKSLASGHSIRTEAFVADIKQKKTKSGKNIGSIRADCVLQDVDGNIAQLKIWSDQWAKYKNVLNIGHPIRAVCKINIWNDHVSLVLERIEKSVGVDK
jgi:DNA polymerase-3 subunit alpha